MEGCFQVGPKCISRHGSMHDLFGERGRSGECITIPSMGVLRNTHGPMHMPVSCSSFLGTYSIIDCSYQRWMRWRAVAVMQLVMSSPPQLKSSSSLDEDNLGPCPFWSASIDPRYATTWSWVSRVDFWGLN